MNGSECPNRNFFHLDVSEDSEAEISLLKLIHIIYMYNDMHVGEISIAVT